MGAFWRLSFIIFETPSNQKINHVLNRDFGTNYGSWNLKRNPVLTIQCSIHLRHFIEAIFVSRCSKVKGFGMFFSAVNVSIILEVELDQMLFLASGSITECKDAKVSRKFYQIKVYS